MHDAKIIRAARYVGLQSAKWLILKLHIYFGLFYSFKFDNFDYDEISLGSDSDSPQMEMALLSHTLNYPTDENLVNVNSENDDNNNDNEYLSNYSSSMSIYPKTIPTG